MDETRRTTVWLVCPNDRPSFQGQWRCPQSGRVRTRSLDTADEAEAERKRSDLEYELNHGLAQGREASGPMRWPEFVARYLKEKLGERAEGTRVKAAQVFADFARVQKPARLASVDERMVARHAGWLRAGGRQPATVAAHLAYLRAALRWAARQKFIRAAPHIEQPAVPDPAIRPWTDEAGYKKLLAAMPSPEWKLLLRVAWHTGFRRGELLALTWDGGPALPAVDLAAGRADLPAPHTKARRARWLPIHPDLMGALRKTPAAKRKGHLFPALRLSPGETGRAFARMAAEAGLPGVGLHGIRRSFGTRYAAVVEAAVLMEMMGHRDIKTTLRYYADRKPHLAAAILKA